MINAFTLLNEFESKGISFFTGVPDSLLKEFCWELENLSSHSQIRAPNEGSAIAIAAGHYLATRSIPLVYLQNSGLGNAINPLVSLTSPSVYQVPLILMIGWRGEPGQPDEPQHKLQGEVTEELLKQLGISVFKLPQSENELADFLNKVIDTALSQKQPVAILVSKGTFIKIPDENSKQEKLRELKREEAIAKILELTTNEDILVSTTGKTSRELYEQRELKTRNHNQDFLNVGAMGHTASIAFSLAMATKKRIFCLDGDGAALMHLGAMPLIGEHQPKNLTHILFNNGCHESVGGQKTCSADFSYSKFAKICGYKYNFVVDNLQRLEKAIEAVRNLNGLSFIEVMINSHSRPELGRPQLSLQEMKAQFMNFIHEE